MRCFFIVLLLLVPGGFTSADQSKPVFGSHEFIEYLPGSLPVVIGAPHGGALKPDTIPERKEGKVVKDAFTQELARLVRDDMEKRFGAPPHVIICRLHRSRVDCNREVAEAAQGDPTATVAFNDFHGFISRACAAVEKTHGAGLYIDLHGHRHEQELVEVGGLIKAASLEKPDAELDAGDLVARQSSLRELDRRSPQSFSALLRGPQSLGGLLEKRGFPSIPSPAHPSPGKNDYFNGAYDITAHGSREGGTVSAVQIECPFTTVREKPESRARFSAALCDALEEYFRVHFQMDLKNLPGRNK